MPHGEEIFAFHPQDVAAAGELQGRLDEVLVGHREGAPVDAEGPPGPQVLMDPHALRGVAVHVLHEPARGIRADRDRRQVKRTKRLANLLKHGAVRCVTREEELALRRAHHEAAPQAGIAVKEVPGGPVFRRGKHNLNVVARAGRQDGVGLPPV